MNLGSRLSRSSAAAGAAVDRSAGTTIFYPSAYEVWGQGRAGPRLCPVRFAWNCGVAGTLHPIGG